MKSLRLPVAISVVLLSSLLLVACNAQNSASLVRWQQTMANRAPTKSTIYVCHSFGCGLKYAFSPSKRELSRLSRILKSGRRSPKAERKAISKAVIWFEKTIGPRIGSDKDIGGLDMQNAGVAGQMDCIDEASNTTSLLSFAQKHGLLKHHVIQSPVARGFFLDGRYPHATAVVLEENSKNRFAIDSWVHDNGVAPVIKPLQVWMAESPARG